MGKIDAWVPKIPRLKSAKVSRFSYRDTAYTNDDIEGVENYDYTRDMNVPTLNKTDTEASVLDSGARAQFSSLSKNALNHFFGRVSYNLNKVIDFLSDLLDDFRVQGVETLRRSANFTLVTYADGKKIRIANTNASNTITCTLPSGQTMSGNGTISIPAGRIIDIELIGSTWKDNLTGNLTGNVTGNADATSDSFVGMIAAFSGTADFSSWLFCDGRAVSRTQYSKLFARIGITWGAGNTTTTFNLPDLREVTLVGAGDSPRVMTDPDVFTVAQFKDATFKSHKHKYNIYTALSKVREDTTSTNRFPNATILSNIDTDSSGSTVTRANSMGVGYFIRSL